MIKKTVTYENFDGNMVEEDLYFHISKFEMVRLVSNGAVNPNEIAAIADAEDKKGLFDVFEKFVSLSYGTRDFKNNRFIKNEESTEAFMCSPAYDKFVEELLSSSDTAVKFVKGIFPNELIQQAISELNNKTEEVPSGPKFALEKPEITSFEDAAEIKRLSFENAVKAEVQRRLAAAYDAEHKPIN